MSPTKPDDTEKFLSWEHRRSREHQRIYTTAHENKHKNALTAQECAQRLYRNHEIKIK